MRKANDEVTVFFSFKSLVMSCAISMGSKYVALKFFLLTKPSNSIPKPNTPMPYTVFYDNFIGFNVGVQNRIFKIVIGRNKIEFSMGQLFEKPFNSVVKIVIPKRSNIILQSTHQAEF